MKTDPFKPSPAILCKLASIAVHTDEMLSPHGHHFDKAALRSVITDSDVAAWIKQMTDMGMAPVKRN